MTKKAVIILGAGAPIAWGGPTTAKITKLLLDSSEFQTIHKENLALYIRDQLVAFYGCDESEINFEHIVNALESLSDYLYESIKGAPPQFVGSKPIWFELSKTYAEIENYKFIPYDQSPDKGVLYNNAKSGDSGFPAIEKVNCSRFYILEVIKHYLSIIRTQIHSYDVSCTDAKYNSVNEQLWNFYTRLKKEGYAVRFYTTNYDELFPKIFKEQHGVQLYSGFDQIKNYTVEYFPNIKEIMLNRTVECYYNLHGSVYWQTGTNQVYEPSFVYSEGNGQTHERYFRSEGTNPAERTTIFNIVTGFSKLQKVSVEPLKSFFNSLAYDCIDADMLVSIGYSYSDNHINNILKHSISENNAKILHITFSENILGTPEYINMQQYVVRRRSHTDFIKNGNWHVTADKMALIYSGGFQNFLENKDWELKDLWS